MKDLLSMTSGHCIAHLGEHGRDEAETVTGEYLGRVQIRKKAGSGGCSCQRVRRMERVGIIMVAGLLQEIKEIFAGDILQKK